MGLGQRDFSLTPGSAGGTIATPLGDFGLFDALDPIGFAKDYVVDTAVGLLPDAAGSLLTNALGALGFAGLFIGGMKLLSSLPDILQGGASDKTKPGKFFPLLADPNKPAEEKFDLVNNIITNKHWTNELGTNNQYIVKPMMEAGALDAYFPSFYAADSQYNFFDGVVDANGLGNTASNGGFSLWNAQEEERYYYDNDAASLGWNTSTMNNIQYGWDTAKDTEWLALIDGINGRSPMFPGSARGGGMVLDQVFLDAGFMIQDPDEMDWYRYHEGDYPEPKVHISDSIISGLGLSPKASSYWGYPATISEEQKALAESLGLKFSTPATWTREEGAQGGWEWPQMEEFVGSGGLTGATPQLVDSFRTLGMDDLAAVAQHQLDATNGGGVAGKYVHFSQVYDAIKESGYPGDISGLEAWLAANDAYAQERAALAA